MRASDLTLMEGISSSSSHSGSRRRKTRSLTTAENRNPLADLTNAGSTSLSSSSPLRPLLDPESKLKSKGKFRPNSDLPRPDGLPSSSVPGETSGGGAGDEPRSQTNPTSSTPKTKKAFSRFVGDDTNCGEPELSVVHTRRAVKGRNSRKKQPTAESSCPPLGRTKTKRGKLVMEETDVNCLKACSVPYEKPKKKRAYHLHKDLPKDFIEKQKAYFDEIDAFELPEEVVSETELE